MCARFACTLSILLKFGLTYDALFAETEYATISCYYKTKQETNNVPEIRELQIHLSYKLLVSFYCLCKSLSRTNELIQFKNKFE